MCHAAARVSGGEVEAVAEVLAGLPRATDAGNHAVAPIWFTLLDEAYLNRRAARRSARRYRVGSRRRRADGAPLFDPEPHRLEGELVLASDGAPAEAEALFRRAIEIGRAQEAKAFGLRAATGLARLWRDQGRAAGARDLVDAKGLLDELRS